MLRKYPTSRFVIGTAFLAVLAGALRAQVDTAWVRRYSGPGRQDDVAWSLALDGSGNVVVTGQSIGAAGDYDYCTVKYDSDGDICWVRRYKGPGGEDDRARVVRVDAAGNAYVTGRSVGEGSTHDYATVKYSPDGDELWVARYKGPVWGHDEAYSLAIDGSGCVYVTGWSDGAGSYEDFVTIKYSPDGAQAWVARYNGPPNLSDNALAVAVDRASNVYVTGWSYNPSTEKDLVIIKYDSNGETLWVRKYNGPDNMGDRGFRVATDSEGNVYVAGSSYDRNFYEDYVTMKYASDGQVLWVRRYDGPMGTLDRVEDMVVDRLGNVHVTGISSGPVGGYDYLTITYSTTGESLWAARYDGPAHTYDYPRGVVVDREGNTYVGGESVADSTNQMSRDCTTIKYGPIGNEVWIARYNGPANDFDGVNAIAVDEDANVYVTGVSTGAGTAIDYMTIKYVQRQGIAEESKRTSEGLPVIVLTNPSRGRILVRCVAAPAADWSLKVYSAQGALVRSSQGRETTRTLDELPAGTYLLQLQTTGRKTTRSVVLAD